MLEGTGPRRLLDLIFGLTEGWWKFADLDLRPHYPLLSPSAWTALLSDEGFTDFAQLPVADAVMPDPDQVVLAARKATATPERNGEAAHRNGKHTHDPGVSAPEAVAASWVLVGNRGGWADALSVRLANGGGTVIRRDDAEDSRIEHTESGLLVSCGAAPFAAEAAPMAMTPEWQSRLRLQEHGGGRLIDLDPAQTAHEQLACLHRALSHADGPRIVVYRGDQRYVPFAEAMPPTGSAPAANVPAVSRAALLAAAPSERRGLIEVYLCTECRQALNLEIAAADLDKPLPALGLDSLMGIQLRNRLEANLGITLSVVDFLKGLSLAQIASRALAALTDDPGSTRIAAPKMATPPDLTAEKVDQLSEANLDALLGSLLE